MTHYCVDTNVFIEAKNRYYRFDMPPGRWFWRLIDRAVDAGIVQSAERMKEELTPAGDELSDWASHHSSSLWIPPDQEILDEVRALIGWAQARVGPTTPTSCRLRSMSSRTATCSWSPLPPPVTSPLLHTSCPLRQPASGS